MCPAAFHVRTLSPGAWRSSGVVQQCSSSRCSIRAAISPVLSLSVSCDSPPQHCSLVHPFDEPLSCRTMSSPSLQNGFQAAIQDPQRRIHPRDSRSIGAGAGIRSESINLHSLCQNHRGLITRSAVSPALAAQLFRPWG